MRHGNAVNGALMAALVLALVACSGGGDPAQGGSSGFAVQAGWPQGAGEGVQGDAGMLVQASETAQDGLPPPPDTSRLMPAQIIDQAGFQQPMVVADLQIPVGWQTLGGVTWNDATTCVANQLQIGWTAIAPDSLTAVEILPGFSWQVAGTEQQMNPCPSAPYRSTREFLEATVQRTREGARVLDYQDQPEVAQRAAQAAQANPQVQARHDAGRLLIAYTKEGVEMREVLTAVVSFTTVGGSVAGGTGMINAVRGPKDRFDIELGQRISASMQPNMQWMHAMRQRSEASMQRWNDGQRNSINDWHNRQMAIINARGAADRHAIRMRTNSEVAGIYNAIASNNSTSSDKIHRQNMEAIGGYNTYAGVDGTTVRNSIHNGNQVFQDTNNPNNIYATDAAYPNPPSSYVELERKE